jgi:DNA primase
MDVLALSQSGICNAVATLGTATTNEHLERLFRVAPEIRFCFDGDSAGKRAAWRALETALPSLRQGRYVGFIFMPEGEDPDSLIRKLGASRFAAQASDVPLSEFLFDTLSSQVDTRTLDGRSRLVELAKPLINKIPTGAFRQLMIERLAELSGLSPDNLSLMVRTVQKSPKKHPRTKAVRSGQPPSLVRIAITLLLHEPSLAAQVVDSAKLHELDLPGIPLLLNVIQLIQQQPQIRCGAILERFRGSVDHSHLAKLLAHDLPIPDEAIAPEFAGVLRRLYRLWEKQQRERLITIPRHERTDAQQQELHRLLAFGPRLS